MMATSMEADSEVHFKEKQEGKGVKTETAVDDATLQFEFRASTPAARGGAPRRGRRGTLQDRAEEIQPAAGEVRRQSRL